MMTFRESRGFSSSTSGELRAPLMSGPPPLSGLRGSMLSSETLHRMQAEAPQLTERDERRSLLARFQLMFSAQIASKLKKRHRAQPLVCGTPPADL